MKKAFLVGAVGCGKTTLKQYMQQEQIKYDKTQSVEFFGNFIDTPGEFTEHRRLYSALSVTANESDVIIMIQSASDHRPVFSPGFSHLFTKPIIGVISKIDLATADDIEYSKDQLRLAGARDIYLISSTDTDSKDNQIKQLAAFLNDDEVKK
ncbi:EutP/PduV family microcompartment system protein [Companilactobacillus metriopterae]|uniref:EutP/PduV family microcompartment system protein n=1 Tax=Companilactobacillus metriopterae TaxID=1909267 RepID=UPI00100B28CA|nr:EutP/PduV family microcompartment system protein [Companilactobacillus metriopterae]